MSTVILLLAETNIRSYQSVGLSLMIWLLIAIIGALLSRAFFNLKSESLFRDIIVGIIGAMLSGFIFLLLGVGGSASMLVSTVAAAVGTILMQLIYHKLIPRGTFNKRDDL